MSEPVPFVDLPDHGRRLTTHRSVRLGDVTPSGRARLDALARYLQDAANDDSTDADLPARMAWVVRRTEIEVGQPPTFREDLDLVTWCSGTGGRWAERRTSITGSDGARVEAAAIWVHIDVDTGRPKSLSPEFFDIYGKAAEGRKVKARLTHDDLPDDQRGLTSVPWTVRSVDIDLFGHVNNAVSWALLEHAAQQNGGLPTPSRCAIEHRDALTLDDTPTLHTATTDQATNLWLTSKTGKILTTGSVFKLPPR